MEFSFMTRYDRHAMTVLARVMRKTVRGTHNRRIRIVGLFLVLFAIFLALPVDGHFSLFDGVTTLLPAVIILLVMRYEDTINGWLACKRILPENREALSAFNDSGYRSSTGMGDTVWRYDAIRQTAETPEYFVFLFDKHHAQLYDKSSLAGGTADEFRAFLQEKTGREVQAVK